MTMPMAVSRVPAPPKTFLEALRYCRNPLLVMHHFREVSNRRTFIARVANVTEQMAQQAIDEVDRDVEFNAEILARRQEFIGRSPSAIPFMFLVSHWGSEYFPFAGLYALVRLLKPDVVVETGGTPGSSSAFILRAMQRNNHGTLITLDLPSLDLMSQIESPKEKIWYVQSPKSLPPGWMVPDSLRGRWRQVLGDARQTLPEVVERYPEIDIFIHDSDHSYQHMLWEFRNAWPHVKAGGLLVSDDIALNTSFYDFAREIKQPYIEYPSYHVGAIKKPLPTGLAASMIHRTKG